MAQLDPNIILSGKMPQFKSQGEVAGEVMSLRNLARQPKVEEMEDMKFQAAKDAQKKEMYSGLIAGVDPTTGAGWDKYVEAVGQHDPDKLKHVPSSFDFGVYSQIKGNMMGLEKQRDQQNKEREFAQKDRELSIKAREKSEKSEELSAGQSKQLGLYKSGKLANDQYSSAVAKTRVNKDGKTVKNSYDPTKTGQWIDNSEWAPNWMKDNNAIEAQNAQSAWVEAFLRDASGAAIPPNERMSYAKDFFPMPGDTPKVVANKDLLRKQKMENSLVGAGSAGKKMIAQDFDTMSDEQIAAAYNKQQRGIKNANKR